MLSPTGQHDKRVSDRKSDVPQSTSAQGQEARVTENHRPCTLDPVHRKADGDFKHECRLKITDLSSSSFESALCEGSSGSVLHNQGFLFKDV